MPFWDLKLDGTSFNDMKRFISGMEVEYEIGKPDIARVSVESVSFLESFFARGKELEIYFSWSSNPTSMVKMFKGKIDKNPEGSASDFMQYTITAMGKSSLMARKEKVRTFPTAKKSFIINQIAGENGYAPVVQIKDASVIKAQEIPIQKGKTDFEFLSDCARKWGCIFWVDEGMSTLYFLDDSEAHKRGNLIADGKPKNSLLEPPGNYRLGYRTDYAPNNIARLQWKFGKPPVANPGSQIANRQTETGKTVAPEDYVYEFYGNQYKFNPSIIAEIKRNPSAASKYLSKALDEPIFENEKSSFWVKYPANGDSKTNKDGQTLPSHKLNALMCDVELNKGDPYLRPPRKASLICGNSNPRSINADLPGWLVNSGRQGREVNINKVKTGIMSGMMKTSLEFTV